MKKINIIIAILSLFAFNSCEDVIEIDLDNIDPKLVIEGIITDNQGAFTVKLSKTGDYFEPGIYPDVSDAVIVISDNSGNTETLQETEAGFYKTENTQGITDVTYFLSVNSDGKEYTARSLMPEKVNINTLSYEYIEATPRFDEGYIIYCHFIDPVGASYYRFKIFLNGILLNDSENLLIRDDKIFEGNEVEIPLMTETFSVNDTITVELLSINKETYNYYKTLINIVGGNTGGGPAGQMSGSTPANPESNLSNGAMGYFSAYTVSTNTIIIQ